MSISISSLEVYCNHGIQSSAIKNERRCGESCGCPQDVLWLFNNTRTRKVTEHQQQLLPVPRQEENAAITTVDDELAPHDRYQKRKWISGIQLSFTIMLYKCVYGNHLGTLVYAWRIPEDQPVDSTITSRISCSFLPSNYTFPLEQCAKCFLIIIA